MSQKKFAELIELLFDGASRLLVCEQYTSGADLAILCVEVLEKSGVQEYELWINRIAVLISKIDANVIERETLVVILKYLKQ